MTGHRSSCTAHRIPTHKAMRAGHVVLDFWVFFKCDLFRNANAVSTKIATVHPYRVGSAGEQYSSSRDTPLMVNHVSYTVRLLTHVPCKPTHFFVHSFVATMSYSLQTSFYSGKEDWTDKFHVWDPPKRSSSRSNSR